MDFPILSVILGTLAVGGALTFLSGRYAKWTALVTSVIFLFESLALLSVFTGWAGRGAGGVPLFSLQESHAWIGLSWLQINYVVGVDGISVVLVLLTAFLQLATVVYSFHEEKWPAAWFGLVVLTCLGSVGVFVALDILLFFLFWEAVLVPMFFMIGYWGGPRRRYAALKFFVYTHVASIVMLVALLSIAFYGHATSFDYASVYTAGLALPQTVAIVAFLGLVFGFGVKFPIFPFHTWLPDAHVEAPTGGSVLLAGLLLKLGGYGLIRWGVLLLPHAVTPHVQWLLYAIAFASIVWGALLSLSQRDMKRLIAYSSINHMGIVLLAIAVDSTVGLTAAVLLMFAHGIVSGLLFMASGSVHHTFGTRDIVSLHGITPKAPVLATLIMVGSLASLGLPALISFPAEFTALVATWDQIGYWVLIPLVMLVVTAAFYTWMMQRMLFGPTEGVPVDTEDIPWHESAGMSILVALTVLYGIIPALLVDVITNSAVAGH